MLALIKTTVCFALVFIAIAGCQKQLAVADNDKASAISVGLLQTNTNIIINQAVYFNDSTMRDSGLNYDINHFYRWVVTPGGCDSIYTIFDIVPGFEATFIKFRCPGTYKVTADIYNRSQDTLLGHADTLIVNVGTDTLVPFQPIQQDDTLVITPQYQVAAQPNPDNIPGYVNLLCSTTKKYRFATHYDGAFGDCVLNYSKGSDKFSYSFTGVKLLTYPMAHYPRGTDKVSFQISDLFEIGQKGADSAAFSVTWLGKTYQGTVKVDHDKFWFNWPDSIPVIISPKSN